jgi:hypothetical protein
VEGHDTLSRSRVQQFIERLLCLAAAILALVAVTALATGGGRLQLGPLQISATDPARVALQASLVWLVAVLVAPWLRQRRALVMASLLAVLVTAVADSTPRRVGDGAEYVAMALNLSRARPPALSIDEKRALGARLVATPGFEDSPLDQPLVGGDGRQDFPHFWLYSLLVSPLLAVGDALGLHPNRAFTVFNVTLVLLLAWALIKDQQTLGAGLLVAGPLLWWVDKAHAEVRRDCRRRALRPPPAGTGPDRCGTGDGAESSLGRRAGRCRRLHDRRPSPHAQD